MTRAELREKAKEAWKLMALRSSHFRDREEAEQVIESFGLEIAKSVAKDMEEILRGQRGDHPSTIRWMLIEEIREYAKRLEVEK